MRFRALLALLSLLATDAGAQSDIALTPTRDTVLFESDFAELSSGQGAHLFCGRLLTGERRRSLLAFDFSAIPSGASILDARLTMYLSKTQSGPVTVRVHRATGAWGEAASDAGFGGVGDMAQIGDASWGFRVFDQLPWQAEGGDFDPSPSAETLVFGLVGPYDWSDVALARDVQRWLDDPTQNDGWILIGAENSGNQTAMRFDSRENFATTRRPVLSVRYQLPGSGPAAEAIPTLGTPAAWLLAGLLLLLGLRWRAKQVPLEK